MKFAGEIRCPNPFTEHIQKSQYNMHLKRTLTTILFGLLLCVPEASGQFVRSQDQTMAGLEGVAVNIQAPSNWPQEVKREMYSNAALELRKSGLTVIEDSSQWNKKTHGILNIGFNERGGGGVTGGSFIWLRMDLEQLSRIVRNGDSHYLVTWYYQDRMEDTAANRESTQMLKKGISQFLNDYFRANGR